MRLEKLKFSSRSATFTSTNSSSTRKSNKSASSSSSLDQKTQQKPKLRFISKSSGSGSDNTYFGLFLLSSFGLSYLIRKVYYSTLKKIEESNNEEYTKIYSKVSKPLSPALSLLFQISDSEPSPCSSAKCKYHQKDNQSINPRDWITCFGLLWHKACFSCNHCSVAIASAQNCHYVDSKLLCRKCFTKDISMVCRSCHRAVQVKPDWKTLSWSEMEKLYYCSSARCRMKAQQLQSTQQRAYLGRPYYITTDQELEGIVEDVLRVVAHFGLVFRPKDKSSLKFELVADIRNSSGQVITPKAGNSTIVLGCTFTSDPLFFGLRKVSQIKILAGLNCFKTATTVAHEIVHAYLFLNGFSLPNIIEEGLCEVVAYFYLCWIIMEQSGGICDGWPESENPFHRKAKSSLRAFELNTTPIYSSSFHVAYECFIRGWKLPSLIQYINTNSEYPLIQQDKKKKSSK